MAGRYNSFGAFMKKTFGVKVHKVNIDAGFTCPNRDGSLGVTGCIYCNNDSFRPPSLKQARPVREQIRDGVSYLRKRYGAERFLAYFQPFTNTYAPVGELKRLYLEALEEPSVIGLAIGTRPDSVDEEKLGLLEGIAKERFVLMEYGLQSVYEKSLEFIKRGHGYGAFVSALRMTEGRGIHAGAHIIVGLPTERREETLAMADEISHLGLGFLKIHQLQVVRDTPLAEMYAEAPFPLFNYGDYLDFIVEFLERLSPEIVIQRLFATAPDDILIAPKWDMSRHEILRDIAGRLELKGSFQGRRMKEIQRA